MTMTFLNPYAGISGMKNLPLKRSLEYMERVKHYASELANRYRLEISDVFLQNVKDAEKRIKDHPETGVNAPYIFSDHKVILQEHYFNSGPASYCITFNISEECIELVSIWHGLGSRSGNDMTRIWTKRRI